MPVDLVLRPKHVLSDYDSSVLCVCYPQILPPEIYNILWDQILRACYHTLLDGFSAVRKCTNEGRALMQLDFRHFQVKVESLTRLRPLPDPHIVETYIKAYYLPENSFEKWIQEQTEYTPRQMMNLLQYFIVATSQSQQCGFLPCWVSASSSPRRLHFFWCLLAGLRFHFLLFQSDLVWMCLFPI
ncbi:hypothetical protein OUZ56_030384 [Daphnia magna]|uniref:Syndetin C-terminal domain-containing protein n=1 Tax=Daphnia magna TaxID=35525 RepID=A0ABQ9ZR49_9CRUS|nr:hypothetical protein OUZ56_030384 [Daphnia magna]